MKSHNYYGEMISEEKSKVNTKLKIREYISSLNDARVVINSVE